MRLWHFLFMILMFARCVKEQTPERNNDKIRLLILSGRNNHEWQKTTPLLVKFYEESGRFDVFVTNSPDTLSYEYYKTFDVVVSNYTPWPEHEYRWPREAEEGLTKYIDEGGGFVLFHAASAAFYSWDEYQYLAGTTWGDSTTHGKIKPHKIEIRDKEHPITENMSDFWITDELWVNAGVNSMLNVLAESYSDLSNKGRDAMEPVVHWKQKGMGRIFHNILGHNERAMKNTGWKTLMIRGTEWAATGKVTSPVPAGLALQRSDDTMGFSWSETDTSITFLSKGNIVWQYNYNTIKGKPFFHPVNINKSTVTWLSPEDHPWHLGIWHSWKYINGVNYWEYDRSDGVTPFNFLGVTEVREINITKRPDFSCIIDLEIYYHEQDKPDLLKEQCQIRVSAPDKKEQFFIDYSFDFKALAASVKLDRTPLLHQREGKSFGGYAGLSVRFSHDLFHPVFISHDNSTQAAHGNSSVWKYVGLSNMKGAKVGVAIFTDAENLNYPEPWFMTFNEDHPFYYFSPAPIFHQPHTIKKGEELLMKYRMQFYSGNVTRKDLQVDYQQFLDRGQDF
jgi:type 1 glutamine amidotransferase